MCFSGSRNGTLILVVLLLLVFSGVQGQTKSFSGTSDELIGLWSGEGEMIEFRSDGKCRYGEALYPYTLTQGFLVIETPGGPVTFSYAIKLGRLALTANGQQSFYTKVTGAAQVKPTFKDVRNPEDLVGQWCYMKSSTGSYSGRCITLRADGTYVYVEEGSRNVQTEEMAGGTASQGTDSGTWYVEGNRLYYQSATEGSGSYRLERRNHPVNTNDPMIVLDEEPFVTTVRRAPWKK
jgi:hypothetical protein